MEQIFKAYGKFLLDAVILALLVLLLSNLSDESGRHGVFMLVGSQLHSEKTNYYAYSDFAAYRSEGVKRKPVISFVDKGVIYTGAFHLADNIAAVDYEGKELPVRMISVTAPGEKELEEGKFPAQGEVLFEKPGIYKVKVSAIDDCNRKTINIIRVPVNR